MNKLIGGEEGLPWAGSWSHLWRPSGRPKPAVSPLNQYVRPEIYSCMESMRVRTHTNTHTPTHTWELTCWHRHYHWREYAELLLNMQPNKYIYTHMCQDAQVDTNPKHKHTSGSKSLPTCAVIYTSLERWASSNKYTTPSTGPLTSRSFCHTHTRGEVKATQGWAGLRSQGGKMCMGVRVGSLWWNKGLCSTCRVSSPHVLFVRSWTVNPPLDIRDELVASGVTSPGGIPIGSNCGRLDIGTCKTIQFANY